AGLARRAGAATGAAVAPLRIASSCSAIWRAAAIESRRVRIVYLAQALHDVGRQGEQEVARLAVGESAAAALEGAFRRSHMVERDPPRIRCAVVARDQLGEAAHVGLGLDLVRWPGAPGAAQRREHRGASDAVDVAGRVELVDRGGHLLEL